MIVTTSQHIKITDLVRELDSFAYEFQNNPSTPGQYEKVGGVIKVWPIFYDELVFIDFFGDEVDSIKTNSGARLSEITLPSNVIYLEDGSNLKPGDYAVHIDHGIGIYRGKVQKMVSDKDINYIWLDYLNQDSLFVPILLQEKVAKYIGVGKKPKLNKLGTQTWQKTKKKAYENALKLARELLQIYARRELSARDPYKIDSIWDKEISKSFGYQETIDQSNAIADVYKDLQVNVPMDRLISGDVGFGKTEIAIRTLTQVVANHKQVAIICPTTLLCQQHYANISARMASLPVQVRMLSRFVSKIEQDEAISGLRDGTVDVVVGTHKLLSDEVSFKDLGLVVIDEEQRFGVKQKDYFKKLRSSIDVLSLSATPIPRTLFMSLSGIRDISRIISAPRGRHSIITEVKRFSDTDIKEYIEREIERRGQVFYLFNRIDKIDAVKNRLQKILPTARFAVAHGRMSEELLEETMKKFVSYEYDVLICTTIIENGLDLPNVNTLIIEEGDRYGLSQLYQIRGRIGRSKKQAYALVTYRQKELPELAFKRLRALIDNSELGSGFNIALSDLEIRGGGNILGREQHGNMESVGITLYGDLLKSAVKKIQAGCP